MTLPELSKDVLLVFEKFLSTYGKPVLYLGTLDEYTEVFKLCIPRDPPGQCLYLYFCVLEDPIPGHEEKEFRFFPDFSVLVKDVKICPDTIFVAQLLGCGALDRGEVLSSFKDIRNVNRRYNWEQVRI